MEDLENSHKKAMEVAVKKIYEINRQTLLDAGKICADQKANYDKILEKYKKLQLHTESVTMENKRLRGLLDDNMRGGSCCASLRQALDTLNSSYKQLLHEKDERIRILEEKLKKYRKDSPGDIDSIMTSPDRKCRTGATMRSTAGHIATSCRSNKSPDSTSHTTPQLADSNASQAPAETSRDKVVVTSPTGAEEDVVSGSPEKSPNCSTRLRLQRTRAKRSRYTEEDVPDSKKARQISPTATLSTNASTNCFPKKSKKDSTKVLVPDTCFPGLDESFQFNSKSKQTLDMSVPGHKLGKSKGKHSRRRKSMPGINYDNLRTIPETLDMFAEFDEDSDVEESQDVDTGHSQGWTMNGVGIKTKGDGGTTHKTDTSACKSNKHADIPNAQPSGDEGKAGEKHNNTKEFRQSVLDSPQSDVLSDQDVTINEAIRNLDLSTFVVDSDEETNTVVEKEEKSQVSYADTSPKAPSVENDCLSQSVTGKTTSPTFSKQRAEQIKVGDSQTILRRSPRRHKHRENTDTSGHENVKPSVSSKRTLHLDSGIDNHRNAKPVKQTVAQDEAGDTFCVPSAVQGDNSDLDMTVAPDNESLARVLETGAKSRNSADNIPNKVFQVKGVKNTSDKTTDKGNNSLNINDDSTSRMKNKNRLLIDSEILMKDMKSPSLLNNKKITLHVSEKDVITIGSPSSGSVSDVESPLLLQGVKRSKEVSAVTNNPSTSNSDWISSKSRKSSLRSSEGNESAISKSSFRKVDGKTKITNKGKALHLEFETSSEAKNNSKNLRQTTLTQQFFASPQKNKSPGKSPDSDSDIQEAIRLSLEEIQRSQNSQDVDDIDVLFNEVKENSPPFKRPRLPMKGTRSSKSLSRKHNEVVETIDLDETVPPHVTRTEDVLHELNDQIANIQHDGGEVQLNGSLDPAVELTEYVASGETLDAGHGMNTVTSLPSIDLDLCTEDLHRRKTSTQAEDDSQIPSSSRSYKFGARKKTKKKYQDTQEMVESPEKVDMDDSFDRLPKKATSEFAHVTVVRKQDERKKLTGHSCIECYDYYKAKGLPEDEIQEQIQKCSRHRAKHLPPDTPPHFWSIGFMDTQECVDRGYIQMEDPDQEAAPSYRRRRKLAKRFKSKNETSTCEVDIDE